MFLIRTFYDDSEKGFESNFWLKVAGTVPTVRYVLYYQIKEAVSYHT
jgi:hypothetical protein